METLGKHSFSNEHHVVMIIKPVCALEIVLQDPAGQESYTGQEDTLIYSTFFSTPS